MNELKATTVYDAYWKANSVGEGTGILVYLKSEADEVIAELKGHIDDGDRDFEIANHQNERLLKIVRHHKYKRCLAMAERCKYRMYYLAAVIKQEASKIIPLKVQIQRYQKRERRMDYWKNRWLELANKFKEAK